MITPHPEFWNTFKKTNGALSVAEAVAIINIAAQAPQGGWAIELGTHMGKSGMSAMLGLDDCFFLLVDPIFEDKKIMEEVDNTLQPINPTVKLKFSPLYSTDILPQFAPYSYCMVDSGSHQDGLPMQEVKLLEDNMMQGGVIVFHDWNSQFKEVKEASDYLVGTGKYDYINIDWDEINNYVNENKLNEGNISWHHTELENPNFVGALRRK